MRGTRGVLTHVRLDDRIGVRRTTCPGQRWPGLYSGDGERGFAGGERATVGFVDADVFGFFAGEAASTSLLERVVGIPARKTHKYRTGT